MKGDFVIVLTSIMKFCKWNDTMIMIQKHGMMISEKKKQREFCVGDLVNVVTRKGHALTHIKSRTYLFNPFVHFPLFSCGHATL